MSALWSERWARKALLRLARRSTPERLSARSVRSAIEAARDAAAASAAYRQLLAEAQVDIARIQTPDDFCRLPILTKENTFGRFGLDELSRPSDVRNFGDVLTSSGRGGSVFGFRITTRRQLSRSAFNVDLGLQEAFAVDLLPTLLVNCLPMGVVLHSRAVTVANVSVREDMACAILRQMGERFAQTVLCTDPLFVRQILDRAQAIGIDWARLNTSVVIGEEMLAEAQRDYIAHRMHLDLETSGQRAIISSFGVGELGLNLLVETRETVRMRRAMRTDADVAAAFGGVGRDGSLPSIFCYSPLRCHVEVLDPGADGYGQLCFTLLDRRAVIPLPRYVTGDMGKLVASGDVERAATRSGTSPPWLPVVAVRGRLGDRDGTSLSVEAVKEILYTDLEVADQLTGAFRASRSERSTSLLMQAQPSVPEADLPALADRLCQIARTRAIFLQRVEVVAAGDFPGRPVLDFERKFPYSDGR